MEAINALHGTRTILIITHRVASVANADAVFRLERGSLVT
jgi:ABC-type transport system involved in cytochrome bd biosynthesis fused ATPase/permease subunit